MGISSPSSIDMAFYDPAGAGTFVLVAVQDRDWDSTVADALDHKLAAYLHYVDSGQMLRQYPQAAGHAVTVQLNVIDPLPEELAQEIAGVVLAMRRAGMGFRIHQLEV